MWQKLPAELRIEILESIPDLPTLKNILIATPSSQPLFLRYFYQIVDSVIQRYPSDIGDVISHIEWSRYRAALPKYWGPESNLPLPEDWTAEADQLAIFFGVAEMAESIELLAERFAEQRVLAAAGYSGGPISPVELYRIQRAFWWFQKLYVDNFRYRDDLEEEKKKGSKRYFLDQTWTHPAAHIAKHWLCVRQQSCCEHFHCYHSIWDDGFGSSAPYDWLIPEIELIRGFLRDEVNTIQIDRYHGTNRSAPVHQQPKLIRQLIKDVESWRTDPEYEWKDQHRLIAELDSRPSLDYFGGALDTPDAAKGANTDKYETRFIKKQQRSLNINGAWGWRLWDVERLVACGLLPKRSRYYESLRSERFRPSPPVQRITELEQFVNVDRSYRDCDIRLKNVVDSRIQHQLENDVAQIMLLRKEKRDRAQIIAWVKTRDETLFEQWTGLLKDGDFDRLKQLQAQAYYKKALLMQSLERSIGAGTKSSEDVDLEVLLCMRDCEYRFYSAGEFQTLTISSDDSACQAVRNRIRIDGVVNLVNQWAI